MPSTSEWTRVIVLAPPPAPGASAGLGDPLKTLFASRDWFAVIQHDPYLAMTELCLRERAQAARSAWGLQRMERLALVILAAETWPQLGELVSAVQRSIPAASIWRATSEDELVQVASGSEVASPAPIEAESHVAPPCEATVEPDWAPFGGDHEEPARTLRFPVTSISPDSELGEFSVPEPAEQGFAPMLRLAGDAAGLPPEAIAGSDAMDEPAARTGRITREEIDMLLQMDLPGPNAGVSA